jgi:hypothetical protein
MKSINRFNDLYLDEKYLFISKQNGVKERKRKFYNNYNTNKYNHPRSRDQIAD